jgi:hypothetical protein
MPALTAPRNTPKLGNEVFQDPWAIPMKAATRGFKGGLAVIDAGYLAPARTAVGLICVGRFVDTYDNTAGAAGAIKGQVNRGTFRWGNSSAGDLIAQANVGQTCYIVDDQTVALTNGGATRSAAGKIIAVDATGVYVETT